MLAAGRFDLDPRTDDRAIPDGSPTSRAPQARRKASQHRPKHRLHVTQEAWLKAAIIRIVITTIGSQQHSPPNDDGSIYPKF
jgi:hypothetical protein